MTRARPSVIVRAKNEARSIETTLRALRDQTVATEVILVDSGSTDGTREVARPYCDQVLSIRPEVFSYGGALNLGTKHASGQIVFALSAHCAPESRHWVEWSCELYDDDEVAGTFGWPCGPDSQPISAPTKVKLSELGPDPTWGFTNHASSWRRSVWETFPFNEDLVVCEDKEWMWRVLEAGHSVVADPRLIVGTAHRRQAGLRALYRRLYREHLVLAELFDYPPSTVGDLARKWWSEFPDTSPRPHWQRRLNPSRAAEMLDGTPATLLAHVVADSSRGHCHLRGEVRRATTQGTALSTRSG